MRLVGTQPTPEVDKWEPSPPTNGSSHRLRPSEVAVLRLLAEGKSNAEIAETMGLSLNTVKNYVATIYLKLGVRRRAEVVRAALRELEP